MIFQYAADNWCNLGCNLVGISVVKLKDREEITTTKKDSNSIHKSNEFKRKNYIHKQKLYL